MAKYLDDNGLLYLWGKIKSTFALISDIPTKTSDLTNDSHFPVDSAYIHTDNNFTTALKNKLDGIATGAQVNVIETVKVNGTALTPSSKAVDISVPTKTSDIENDSHYAVDASYVHTDNNFTTALKNKLDGVASGAQANVIETVKVNNTALTPSNKAVNITVPTKTSDITNDSDFVSDDSYIHTDNNYTTTEKNKLSNIAAGAQVNVIETIKVNNTALTPSSKAVNITVPTQTSQLTNNSGFQTASDVETAINTALADITGINFEIVQTLPATGVNGTIYLLSNSGTGTNSYDEYIYISNKWEKIGTTDVDLTGYYNTTNLIAVTNAEIDVIVAS